jgi:hypothetical protein
LIREELQSGKVIHEVVASRYKGRQREQLSGFIPDDDSERGQAHL